MIDEEIIDGLQDVKREIVKLSKAVLEQAPPVVNVAAPTVEAPDVNVAAPVVNVTSPVTVEPARKVGWQISFERDSRDRIKSPITLTPIE